MPRYMRKGVSRAYADVASTAPAASSSAAAIVAMLRLDTQLESITGFEFQNQPIMTPDMSSAYTTQIGGEDTAPASSLTFYELDGGIGNNPIQSGLAKGFSGFIYLIPDGSGANNAPAATDHIERWPVTITSNSRQWSVGNDPARYVVAFAVTAPPNTDLTLGA